MVALPLAQAILFPIVVLIGAVASVHFLRGWRRTDQLSARSARLLAAAVCICLTLKYSIGLPGVWTWLNRSRTSAFAGANLLSPWLSFAVIACLVCLLIRWNYVGRQRGVRTHLALGALTVAQIATTWIALANGTRHSAEIDDYFAWYTDPWFTLYIALGQTVLAAVLVWAALLARRFARTAKGRWLRTGLWITALGALLTLGQCLIVISVLIAAHFGIVIDENAEFVEAFTALGALAILTGLSLPSAVPGLRALIERHQLTRAHRQLAPLHRLVAHLELANQQRAVAPSADPRTQLVRCIAEIRDGLLVLRAYDDPETAAQLHRELQRNGHADQHDPELAAARITAALARHQANRPVPQFVPAENPPGDTRPPIYDVLPHYIIGGATPETEARWLTKVSRALARTRK